MKFKKLTINDWKKIEKVDIDFHPQLTVLTGANGSGKTTILNLLGRHVGWEVQELCVPIKDKETGTISFFARLLSGREQTKDYRIGELTYGDGKIATLDVPQNSNAVTYQITINGFQSQQGLMLPSLRPVFSYRQVSQLSMAKRDRKDAFNLVSEI